MIGAMPEWYVDQQRSKVNFSTALPTLVPNVDIYRIVVGADDAQFVARDAQLSYLWARAGQTVRAEDKAAAIAAQSTDPVPAVLVEAPTIGQGNVSAPDATATSKGVIQLAGDIGGTAASPTVAGVLRAQNNLTDLTSTATARTSLGLGTAATQPATAFTAAPATPVASSATSGTLTAGAEHTLTPASAATRTLPTGVTSTAITPTTVKNNGTANVTIARGGSDTINGGTASIVVAPGEWARLASDGSGAWTAAGTYGQNATYASISTDPFRFDATRLRGFKSALANVASAPVDILTVGDSIAEGQGGTAITKRWLDVLRDRLRTRYQPAGVTGGEGYVPSYYGLSGYTQRVTYTGTTSNTVSFGLGRRSVTMSTAATASLTFTGTGVDVLYAKGGSAGNFTWAIDGGGTTTVNGNNATVSGGNVAQVRGLSAASHTIVITASTASTFLEGFMVYNGDEAAGIRVRDGGHYGNRTADFLDETNQWAYGAWTAANPHLVIWELTGVNDFGNATAGLRLTPAQMSANISTLLARVRARTTVPPSVLMVLNYERGGVTGTPLDTWANYVQAVSDFAKADGSVALVDINSLFGTAMTGTDTYGLANADKVHPSDKGHALIAEQMFRVLTAV